MKQNEINKLPTQVKIDGDHKSREVYVNGKFLSPDHSQTVRNHSPDGFNWGYGGSGPAQLSLAILLKFMNEKDAQQYYHDFKFKVVAGWPQGDFDVNINLREFIDQNTPASEK